MRFTNDPIPDCVPEYYRVRQEEYDRQYDLAMQRRGRYLANKQKLYMAAQSGLDSHEYGYTGDTEEALDALGYMAAEVLGDPRLKRGIEKAVTEICNRHD